MYVVWAPRVHSNAASIAAMVRARGLNDDAELLLGGADGSFQDLTADVPMHEVIAEVLKSTDCGIKCVPCSANCSW